MNDPAIYSKSIVLGFFVVIFFDFNVSRLLADLFLITCHNSFHGGKKVKLIWVIESQ